MFAWIFNVLILVLAAVAAEAMPSQVIIVRHAERFPTQGVPLAGQLDAKGFRRAGALASYLTLVDPHSTNPPLFANGPPTAVFAARPEAASGHTVRCIQTITPTAATLRLPIHAGFGDFQEQELANLILTNPRYDGKNVLICWHSETIGALIEAFGYPFAFDPYPSRFDLVWLLTFPVPANPQAPVPILQELLFGDSATPP